MGSDVELHFKEACDMCEHVVCDQIEDESIMKIILHAQFTERLCDTTDTVN